MLFRTALALTGALLCALVSRVAAEGYIPEQGSVAIVLNQPECLLQFFSTSLFEKDPYAVDNATCTPWNPYPRILSVSNMVVSDLNAQTDLLPNHQITLPTFNPKGVALVAAERFMSIQEALKVISYTMRAEALASSGMRNESDPTQPRSVIGIVGPSYADSTSASALAYSAADMMQVAPLVPAADLSDASKYPYLLRLRGSEHTQAAAILDLCLAVGLKRVALLHSNDIYGNSFHSNLEDAIKKHGDRSDLKVEYKAAVPLSRFLSKNTPEYASAEEKLREHMRAIKQQQLRVIVLYTTTGDDALLYDIVAKDETTGGEFADFFASHQQLIIAPADWPAFVGLAGKKRPGTLALTFPSQMHLKDDDSPLEIKLWSREGNPERKVQLRSKKALHDALSTPSLPFSKLSTGIHFVAESAYDSILLLALTFDELLERNRTATPGSSEAIELAKILNDRALFGQAMQKAVKTKKFVGHSGPIEFDGLLDRKPQYGIGRWQSNLLTSGDFQVIGQWNTDTHSIAFFDGDSTIISNGEDEDVVARVRALLQVDYAADAVAGQPGDNALLPSDGPRTIRRLKQVNVQALGITLGVIGIACALAVVVYINMKRDLRYVKMGAPNIQTIQLLGIIFAFTSLLYAHMDTERFDGDDDKAENACRAVFWTEQLSFAVVFGALLAKALRVYIIFTRNDWTIVRITDKHLAAVVAFAVLVASIIMLIFDAGYDAIYQKFTLLSVEYDAKLDANVHLYSEECKIRTAYDGSFYAVTLGFQCLLMIGGLWLANELRGVSIPALNDSADVRQTMVLVFVIALLTKPTKLLVESDDPRSVYVLTVISTFLLNFSALVYLFAGRVFTVLRGNHVVQTGSISSMGTGHHSSGGDSTGKKGSSTGDEIRLAVSREKNTSSRGTSTTRSTQSSTSVASSSLSENKADIAMTELPEPQV